MRQIKKTASERIAAILDYEESLTERLAGYFASRNNPCVFWPTPSKDNPYRAIVRSVIEVIRMYRSRRMRISAN